MFIPDYECLIELMAGVRKKKGVTQVDLATARSKRQSFASNIENSKRRLELIEMVAIADAPDAIASPIYTGFKHGFLVQCVFGAQQSQN